MYKHIFLLLSQLFLFQSLRITQYNAEWLFIDYYAGMDCPGNGCTWHSKTDATTHLNYVANAINTLNPDIINICEVEGINELNMLREYLDTNLISYLKQGTDTGTGQNVGLLSKIKPSIDLYRTEEKVKYPIENSLCGSNITGTTGVSKHYITEFKMNNMDIALIGIHLLAIPTDPDRCVKREAQAQVIQNVVTKYIQRGFEVIVLGDMNDYDAEVLDLNSNKPTSRVLDILKGNYLINVAININKNDRYSDWWDSDNNCNTNSNQDLSMIDHILISDKLTNYIKDVFIYHGYAEYCGKWNSDHWPLVIDFYDF